MQKPIYEIFDSIRSGEMGNADLHKFLKEYSNNYDYEVLRLLLRDLEFYFFMEKEEKESEFSWEEKDKIIKDYEERKKEIPIKSRLKDTTNLTELQLENRERLKNTGWDLDKMPPIIDWEKILYPFEFFCLYQFQWLLKNKIKEVEEKGLNKNKLTVTETFETPEIEPKTKTPFTTPEKIALLQITELEKYFDTLTGDIAEQKYRLLSTLFGVSFDTVKKCYLNNSITGLHKKRAKDFFNNKFN